MSAPDFDAIPAGLTGQDRWVLWRVEERTNRKTGEVTKAKPPISYRTGKKCDVADPRSWTTFARVSTALTKAAAWDGIGFALGTVEHLGEVWFGIDYDSCLGENSDPLPWVLPFLAVMPTYTERSPGGLGLKSVARIRLTDLDAARKLLDIPEGDKEQARTRTFAERANGQEHAPHVQLFLMKRFFTITGQHWPTAPEEVRLITLDQIADLARLFGPRATPSAASTEQQQRADDDDTEPDEAALRDKLDAVFQRNRYLKDRWDGGTQGLIDTTRSGRDMSILAMLVRENFTKGEVRLALRLFKHGKMDEEPPRYFERMWANTKATPHVDPEPPPDWEERHPPPGAQAPSGDGAQPPPPPEPPPEPYPEPSRSPQPRSLPVWDPWEDPQPPPWPGGILSPQFEDTLAAVGQRDGVDFGMLGMAVIGAVSTAAAKDARFSPYVSVPWTVPPILWIMLIGESGLRKTLLDGVAFAPIRALQSSMWRDYRTELNAWKRADKKERGDRPEEPHSYIVNDYSAESLQLILDRTSRGTAVVKDEIAGFFDFNRYGGKAPNHSNRASSSRPTRTSRILSPASAATASTSNMRASQSSAASSRTSSRCSPAWKATDCFSVSPCCACESPPSASRSRCTASTSFIRRSAGSASSMGGPTSIRQRARQ
jgi:hypothetical protein